MKVVRRTGESLFNYLRHQVVICRSQQADLDPIYRLHCYDTSHLQGGIPDLHGG